jgi:hypothetical protein
MPVEPLPIFCYYDVQRFKQFGAMDCAGWYGLSVASGKKKQAMYPTMGRQHVSFLNQNRLIFNAEPRAIYRSLNFFYVIDGTQVIQFNKFYNAKPIGSVSLTGQIWFDYLTVGLITYAILTDEKNAFLITENGSSVTMALITDSNLPANPQFVAAFGNRFVLSIKDTPFFYLSTINATGGVSAMFSFGSPPAPLFAQASGVIGQFGVLHGLLYIFNTFTTDIWSNTPTTITVAGATTTFPWKLNSSYNWDYGIADPALT